MAANAETSTDPPGAIVLAVRSSIALVANVSLETIDESTDLLALGLDSLDFSSILVEIEAHVGAMIPDDMLRRVENSQIETVADVLALLAGWDPAKSDG